MIAIHVSAVCRVRDGYTGSTLASGGLRCCLDGAPCQPVRKPGGCLVLTNLPPGRHLLSLQSRGYQEEWVELTVDAGTQEVEVTMKPGADYPFQLAVTRLELEILEKGRPAAGRQFWLAAPSGPEMKIAQTRAEAGSTQTRLFCKGALPPAVPGTYLIADGADSEVVVLRSLAEETGTLAAPLLRSHSRGRMLIPAQSYHTNSAGRLSAAFREPCVIELCSREGVPLGRLELQLGENRQRLSVGEEKKYGESSG